MQIGGIAHTQPHQYAGRNLLIPGEVLGNTGRLDFRHHIGQKLLHLVRQALRIDHRRSKAAVDHFYFRFVFRCGLGCDFFQLGQNLFPGLGIIGTQSTIHDTFGGHDIVAGTGMEFTKEQDAAVTVCQCLRLFRPHKDLCHGHQCVIAPLPNAAMGTQSTAADLDSGGRSHQGACLGQHLTLRNTGPNMHAEHRRGVRGHRTGLNHLLGTGHALFRRLEQETDILRQSLLLQFLCRRQQHGHMGIVTAGVHDTGVL